MPSDPGDTTTDGGTCPDPPQFEAPVFETVLPEDHPDEEECLELAVIGGSNVRYEITKVTPDSVRDFFSFPDDTVGIIKCHQLIDNMNPYVPPQYTLIYVRVISDDGSQDEAIGLITLTPGPPDFSLTDFNTDTMTVGYPSFVTLEYFISMPITQVLNQIQGII